MSDKRIESLLNGPLADEASIEKLIQLGGERKQIDPACTERVRQQVYQAWAHRHEQKNEQRATQHEKLRGNFARLFAGKHGRTRYTALAAGFAFVAIAMISLHLVLTPPTKPVANVIAVAGEVIHQGALLTRDGEVLAGADVTTGPAGGLSLKLASGALLKVDRLSRIRFLDTEDVQLVSGSVYFDSRSRGNIRVHTEQGIASDLGTQFETSVLLNELIVRVREGKVRLDQKGNALLVNTGQALQVAGGAVNYSELPPDDEHWVWVDAVGEGFNLDGRSMAEILAWLARREGWRLEYEHDQAHKRARADIVNGRMDIANGKELLRQLSLISDMEFTLHGKNLSVAYPR